MSYIKEFSIIVPCWRGAVRFLPTLFNSIPEIEEIEIIVVDNSEEPLKREEIDSHREIVLLHSAPNRHAGGSRNDGMAAASGKWLLFADADDYYSADAFDIYYEYLNSDAEIIYTGMGGVDAETGEPASRGDFYIDLVHNYCIGEISELELRMRFGSPCCKMVSHALVDREGLRYDEIKAGNDVYFSLTSGYYAKKVIAIDRITYIATVNKGSLCTRRSYEVLKSRYYSRLHCNQFKKKHHLSHFQESVMSYLFECRHYGLKRLFVFIGMLFKFRQNPLIGWKRWLATYRANKQREEYNKKYIVKE